MRPWPRGAGRDILERANGRAPREDRAIANRRTRRTFFCAVRAHAGLALAFAAGLCLIFEPPSMAGSPADSPAPTDPGLAAPVSPAARVPVPEAGKKLPAPDVPPSPVPLCSARLAKVPRGGTVRAGGLDWSCEERRCTAPCGADTAALSACRALARAAGKVERFSHPRGRPPPARCNSGLAAAPGVAAESLGSQALPENAKAPGPSGRTPRAAPTLERDSGEIAFGDGRSGARPPTGAVAAGEDAPSYRRGAGPSGRVGGFAPKEGLAGESLPPPGAAEKLRPLALDPERTEAMLRPNVAAFDPARAWPGREVAVLGSRLGDGADTELVLRPVGGGASRPLAPLSWSPSRIELSLPDDLAAGTYEAVARARDGSWESASSVALEVVGVTRVPILLTIRAYCSIDVADYPRRIHLHLTGGPLGEDGRRVALRFREIWEADWGSREFAYSAAPTLPYGDYEAVAGGTGGGPAVFAGRDWHLGAIESGDVSDYEMSDQCAARLRVFASDPSQPIPGAPRERYAFNRKFGVEVAADTSTVDLRDLLHLYRTGGALPGGAALPEPSPVEVE